MRQKIVQQFHAFGSESPAREIKFSGQTYKLHQVFKHDFFAVTAMYSHSNSNGSYDKE
ncbi:MAG: hypothetical protein WCZ89_00200 [Phycisphaerae bacterium]